MTRMKFDDDDQTEVESEKQTGGLINFIKDLFTPIPNDDHNDVKKSEAARPIPTYKPKPKPPKRSDSDDDSSEDDD